MSINFISKDNVCYKCNRLLGELLINQNKIKKISLFKYLGDRVTKKKEIVRAAEEHCVAED